MPGPLLNEKGELNTKGYATSLVAQYSRSAIKAMPFQIKEWDYYLLYNKEYAIALTVADNSYMALVSASVINFKTPCEKTTSAMEFFTFGKLKMPQSSESGDVLYKNKGVSISFEKGQSSRLLKIDWKKFDGEKNFAGEFVLTDEPKESMVIATPFADKPKAFYYNQKIVGMKVEGQAQYGEERILFLPTSALAILDWGRGVWSYSSTWYWSAATGYLGSSLFGFNFGYGFGDTSAASENMLFYRGKAHKLDDVKFEIPTEKGKEDFLQEWKIVSSDGRVDLNFNPIIDRANNINAVVLASNQHQVFGRFSGKVVLDSGQELKISELLGFAEKVVNRW